MPSLCQKKCSRGLGRRLSTRHGAGPPHRRALPKEGLTARPRSSERVTGDCPLTYPGPAPQRAPGSRASRAASRTARRPAGSPRGWLSGSPGSPSSWPEAAPLPPLPLWARPPRRRRPRHRPRSRPHSPARRADRLAGGARSQQEAQTGPACARAPCSSQVSVQTAVLARPRPHAPDTTEHREPQVNSKVQTHLCREREQEPRRPAYLCDFM